MRTQEEIEEFIRETAQQVKARETGLRFALARVWSAACTHMAEQYKRRESERPRCNCAKHN